MIDAQLVHIKSPGKVDVLSDPVWLMPSWFISKVRGKLMSYPAQYN